MCKLFYATNICLNKTEQKELLEILGDGQPHGIGVVSTVNNNIDIYHSAETDNAIKAIDKTVLPKQFLTNSEVTDDFLAIPEKCDSLFIHTRYSTNEITLNAVHPFEINNTLFAHNGVIVIPDHDYPTITTNDSEFLAHDYKRDKIKALQNFNGYAATMQYNFDTCDMEIYRDDSATLYVAFSEKLNSVIITTKEADLTIICDMISDDFSVPQLLKDNVIFTLTLKNEVLNTYEIQREVKIFKVEKDVINKSLGIDHDNYDNYSSDGQYNVDYISNDYDEGYETGYQDAIETMQEDNTLNKYNVG